MRMIPIVMTCLILLLLPQHEGEATDFDQPSDHGSWWVEYRGVVTEGRNPLVKRAGRVFERVSAAARKGSRFPKLIIIGKTGRPMAKIINDGSIILSEDALGVCYGGLPPERGDARLAFVLGHELAHLARDDFRQNLAASAVKDYTSERPVRESLLRQMNENGTTVPQRELQADSNAIVTMAVAGYDPGEIVGEGKNFFTEWNRLGGDADAGESGYPSSKDRGSAILAQLREIAGDTGLFSFGIRLYQLGRYQDAILLFEKFRVIFPDKGAYNNNGLAYYQLALRELAECDEALLSRFMLSTLLETATFGSRRGRVESACLKSEKFRGRIREALRNLERARDQDPTDMGVRINLTSAHIMAGDYAAALAVAGDSLKIDPAQPEILNNKAVALYLFGMENDVDAADNAVAILKKIVQNTPFFPNAHYNMAAILSERGRHAAARQSWRNFITIEKSGIFARMAEKKGGIEPCVSTDARVDRAGGMSCPVPLGRINAGSLARLRGMTAKSFSIGSLNVEIFATGDTKVLALGEEIEIVETRPVDIVDRASFIRRHGEPEKAIRSITGEMLIYGHFAVDVEEGRIVKVVFHAEEGGI